MSDSYDIKVFEKRNEMNISVDELSKKTGVSVGNIKAIERGKIPNFDDRLRISSFLGLDKIEVTEI